jgi:hypothetical protein
LRFSWQSPGCGISCDGRIGSFGGTHKVCRSFLEFARTEAAEILAAHRTALEAIAAALIERKTLDGEQIDAIISETVACDALEAERARRLNWHGVAERAAAFKASLCIRTNTKNVVTN